MKSGIYVIRNVYNDKHYVGSSINIKNRWKRHIRDLCNKRHHSIHLQRFVNKYGIKSLKFEVLEYCNNKDLLSREQYYLEQSNCEFNICKIAGSPLGTLRSEDFKQKISVLTKGINNPTYGMIRTAEWRKNISDANKGKVAWNKGKTNIYSEDTLSKMRINAKNRIFSDSTRLKISESNSKIIYQYSKEGIFIKEWKSLTECAKKLNIKASKISSCANENVKTVSNFIFRYYKKDIIDVNLKHKSCKIILQYDKQNNFIKEWESAKIAAKELNGNDSNINIALKNNNKTAYGYYWKYK